MKNKTIRRILSFTLAFILCFSIAVKPIEAKALAVESWVIWAIITYLTSVGLVFTATGGAKAVYDAVEEKVNQYGDNVIDFYDIVRGNLRIVKPPNLPPNWNPDIGNLFITAVGVEALGKFAEWLTSEGGWLAGTNVNEGYSFGTLEVKYRGAEDTAYSEPFTFATSLIEEWETSDNTKYKRAKIKLSGSALSAAEGCFLQTVNADLTDYSRLYLASNQYYCGNYINDSFSFRDTVTVSLYISKFTLNTTVAQFIQNAEYAFVTENGYVYSGVIFDGYFYYIGRASQVTVLETTLSADIEIPTELPEIKPLPTLEGLLLESESLAADSLEALGNVIETYFNDAGTIPAPQPNIIPDPEVAPVPTPAPSPDYPDVGELGLPSLGDALKSKFPFSLPWTFGSILGIFLAPRQTPKWEVDLPAPLNTSFTIDLSPYEQVGYVSRWMSDIGYAIALLLATRKFIHW